MQNMRAFKTVCPLRNQLHLDITTAIKVRKTQGFYFPSPFLILSRGFKKILKGSFILRVLLKVIIYVDDYSVFKSFLSAHLWGKCLLDTVTHPTGS